MSEHAFLVSLQKIVGGQLSLPELIDAATVLTGAGQSTLAQQLYQVWCKFNPEHPHVQVAHFNCAVLQSDAGDLAGAVNSLTSALKADPEFMPAYINLGTALERGGQPELAIEQWKTLVAKLGPVTGQAIEYKTTAMKQIARVLGDQHQQAAAEAVMQECLTVRPDQRDVVEQYMAVRLSHMKWPIAQPFGEVSKQALVAGIHPLSMCAYTDDPLLQLAAAARYSERAVTETAEMLSVDRRAAKIDLNGRRLRIGYISSDLREHAIGYLMAELFELHDRSKVEVFAYYCGIPSSDGLNTRIKSAVEHWRDIRTVSDDEAARMIAADGIDILVDVNGHTKDSRTGVFARRPAPVLVNWLGYPGTMGTPYHHYIVADDWIIPPSHELYYSEKVLRLPCYQPNDRKRVVAPRPSRAEAGLPENAFVFCCFNGHQKVTRFTFMRWMEILRRVDGSVLWLLDTNNAETAQRMRLMAEQLGVSGERLIFAPKLQNAYHLARYPLADLFLDTSPYGAHTTASDALWMGVPVLTVSGRCFASRVCGSLVRAAGLPELLCDSPENYVEMAVALGHDRPAVQRLREKLEANRATCDLFNMEQLAARLEALYAEMAQAHAAGLTPQPELANLDTYFAIGTAIDHEAEEMTPRVDLHGLYRGELARRDRLRPLHNDGRLWGAEPARTPAPVVEAVEAAAPPRRTERRRRAAVG